MYGNEIRYVRFYVEKKAKAWPATWYQEVKESNAKVDAACEHIASSGWFDPLQYVHTFSIILPTLSKSVCSYEQRIWYTICAMNMKWRRHGIGHYTLELVSYVCSDGVWCRVCVRCEYVYCGVVCSVYMWCLVVKRRKVNHTFHKLL